MEITVRTVKDSNKRVLDDGTIVRITESWSYPHLVGVVVPLRRTDDNDAVLTYSVFVHGLLASRDADASRWCAGTDIWVERVEAVEFDQEPVSGRRIRVMSVDVPSLPLAFGRTGTITNVMSGNVLSVRFDEPVANDQGIAQTQWVVPAREALMISGRIEEGLIKSGEVVPVEEIDPKDAEIARLQALYDQSQTMLRDKIRQHDDYRTLVRDEALRVKQEMDWCDEGTNLVLETLGLDPVERDYEVMVEITAKQTVTITVTAASPDDAQEQVENDSDLAWNEASAHGWEFDEQSVDDVSAA